MIALPPDDAITGITVLVGDGPSIACVEAIESDRAWFQNHAGRTHRLRPPTAVELAAFQRPPRPGFEPMIAVRQVVAGWRLRAGLYARRSLLNSEEDAAAAFNIAVADARWLGDAEQTLRATP